MFSSNKFHTHMVTVLFFVISNWAFANDAFNFEGESLRDSHLSLSQDNDTVQCQLKLFEGGLELQFVHTFAKELPFNPDVLVTGKTHPQLKNVDFISSLVVLAQPTDPLTRADIEKLKTIDAVPHYELARFYTNATTATFLRDANESVNGATTNVDHFDFHSVVTARLPDHSVRIDIIGSSKGVFDIENPEHLFEQSKTEFSGPTQVLIKVRGPNLSGDYAYSAQMTCTNVINDIEL